MTDAFDGLTAGHDDPPSVEFTERLRSRVAGIEARAAQATRREWHLAELNLGVFRAPLDSPEMAEFANALDRINALAEASPGFVWRLTDADGGPSSNVEVPGATDELLASNLSVWTDLESLRDYMYRTHHASYLRRRADWFQREREPMIVAWWIPAGTVPTLEDALARLDHLRRHGPSDIGFPLGRTIPPPPKEPTMATSTVIPYLTVGDTRAALLFYAEVFGAEPQGEMYEMEDGRIGHAEMAIGGQVFYLADEFPEMNLRTPSDQGSNSVSLVLHVADCDATYEAALAAGATGERPPSNQHGHRIGWFVDPWGHRWSPTSAEV